MRAKSASLWTSDFLLVTLGNALFFVTLFFLMPILPLFVVELGASQTQVGMVTSVSALGAIISRLLSGSAVDRWGSRRFLIFGSVVNIAGAIMLILSTNIGMVLFSRALQGISLGLFTTAASTMVAHIVPVPRRAEGLGWFGLSGNVAMAIGPVGSGAIALSLGYLGVFWASAIMALGALGIVFALRKTESVREESPVAVAKPSYQWIRLSRGALIPALVMLSVTFGFGGMMTFVPIRGSELGLTNVGFFFSALALAQIVSRVSTARLADRFGRFAVILPSLSVMVVGLVLLAFAESAASLGVVAVFFGLGWGALMPAILALAIDRAESDERGAAMGTFFAAVDLGVAVGTALLGALIQFASFEVAFLVAAALGVVGTAASVIDYRGNGASSQVESQSVAK